MKLMLHGTHHSSRLMGGGGLMGSMRTTDESTLGGGRKLFLPTCSRVAMSGHCGSLFCMQGCLCYAGLINRPENIDQRCLSSWRRLTLSRWLTRASSCVLTASRQYIESPAGGSVQQEV